MKLPIGTKVSMSQLGREIYRNSYENPHNGLGVITGRYNGPLVFDYRVKWDNDHTNVYRHSEVEPVVDLSNKTLEDYL